jgi:hypothetical protein
VIGVVATAATVLEVMEVAMVVATAEVTDKL